MLKYICFILSLVRLSFAIETDPTATEMVIDDFDYETNLKIQKVWRGVQSEPPDVVKIIRHGYGLKSNAHFSQGIQRVSYDRDIELDLSMYGSFTLDIFLLEPWAFHAFTLYFKSGDGWFGCYSPMAKLGWQRLTFNKLEFHPEGNPDGWHNITGIRLSAWSAQKEDCQFVLDRLLARRSQIAIILPTTKSGCQLKEVETAKKFAQTLSRMFATIGLLSDSVTDHSPSVNLLVRHKYKFVVLPMNPKVSPKLAIALKELIVSGGKILAIYKLDKNVAQLIGVRPTGWVQEENDGQFAEIRFPEQHGFPKSVKQASWNITVAEPIDNRSRVVGIWYDSEGNPSKYPAVIVGKYGAFFSHLILNDDLAQKQQMLAAVVGHFFPNIHQMIAKHLIGNMMRVGHFTDRDKLERFIKRSSKSEATKLLNRAKNIHENAIRNYENGNIASAIEMSGQARDLLSQAYLFSQDNPTVEGRAIWNHSGTGAYPGDWDRSAYELAAAGFNMIFPNMLWAGLAHYASDILPRSWTFDHYGDQISQCVLAARKHGLEVHIWKVNWNLSNAPKSFVETLRQENRLQKSKTNTEILWLCPSHQDNRKLEIDSLIEVTKKYDIDGIHFDYIRYPSSDGCYCDNCRQGFTRSINQKVKNWPANVLKSGEMRKKFIAWRADQITILVKAVSEKAKLTRPNLKISAAVFNDYPYCVQSIGQDWVKWAKLGYVDFLCPMNYTADNDHFSQMVQNHKNILPRNFPVYPGIGATASIFSLPVDQVAAQIYLTRQFGSAGFAIFDYSKNTSNILIPAISKSIGAHKAKIPH
ncbi:TPA: hypothetical protein EYN98_32320 [Candidatus Poribacteria bacterium]|nr:hypothetical protein [Candidatus Poribacteria bacterium]